MRFSLRLSVTLLVAVVNLAVFGAGLVFLNDAFAERRRDQDRELSELQREFSGLLAERLLLDAEGNLKALGILRWLFWDNFEDAIIVQLSPPEEEAAPGSWEPRGVFLNPMGSSRRLPTFDYAGMLDDIERCVTSRSPVTSSRGTSVPVYDTRGNVWGGCWFLPRATSTTPGAVRQLLPWFLGSTLLLTIVTVFALHKLVLHPVRQLASAAGALARGELSARLPEPSRRDELSDLVRGFNSMAGEVQGFNERLASEVRIATKKARDAEAAAMTQRRLAATGELAAGIAHEINNPLGGMLNALEALESGELAEEKRNEYRALLKMGLERIGGTVGRVLRLAPRVMPAEMVSLVQPIEDAVGLVRHRAQEMGVELLLRSAEGTSEANEKGAFDGFRDLPTIAGESNELGQAVLNLLVNALDALEDLGRKGRIEIGLERAGDELHLTVEDDGPGLAPELLARVPDLFYTTKVSGKGTGLGLAIVHNVVDAHGGRVLLSSSPGRGFRVDVYLPIPAGTAGREGAGDGA